MLLWSGGGGCPTHNDLNYLLKSKIQDIKTHASDTQAVHSTAQWALDGSNHGAMALCIWQWKVLKLELQGFRLHGSRSCSIHNTNWDH